MKNDICNLCFTFLLLTSMCSIINGQHLVNDSYQKYFGNNSINTYSYIGITLQYQFFIDKEKFLFENTTDSFIGIACGSYKVDLGKIKLHIDTLETIELIKELNNQKDRPLKYSLLSKFDAYRDWQFDPNEISFSFYNRISEERLFSLTMKSQDNHCK